MMMMMSTVVVVYCMSFCAAPKAVRQKATRFISLPLFTAAVGEGKGKDSGKGDKSQLEFAKATPGPNSDPISQRLVCFVLFVRRSGHDASEVEAANLGGFVDLGRRDLGRG